MKGVPTLDLDYALDSHAEADVNVVMTRQHGEMAYAEVQGTGEGRPYRAQELNALLDLAQAGVAQLMDRQIEALGEAAASSAESRCWCWPRATLARSRSCRAMLGGRFNVRSMREMGAGDGRGGDRERRLKKTPLLKAEAADARQPAARRWRTIPA